MDVMIISTQTPLKKQRGYTPGKVSLTIQKITDAGLVFIHPGKKLHDEEKEIFFKHLKSGGWLIITGDGLAGTGKIQINCTAEEYVALVVQTCVLKEYEKLNILLYARQGALRSEIEASFARQLAEKFAAHKIFTEIIATVGTVQRIDGANNFDDIEGEQIRFRTDPKDLRHFSAGPNQEIQITQPDTNFYITKKSLGFSYNFENSINKFLKHKLANKIPENPKDDLVDFICSILISPSDDFFESHLKFSFSAFLEPLTPNQTIKIKFLLKKIIKNYLPNAFPSTTLRNLGLDEEILKKRILSISSYIDRIYGVKHDRNIVDFVNYKMALKSILENSIERNTSTRPDAKEKTKLEKNECIQKIFDSMEEIKYDLDNYSSIEAIKKALKKLLEKVIEIDSRYPSFRFFSKTLEQKLSPFIPPRRTLNPIFRMN